MKKVPFSKDELEVTGYYYVAGRAGKGRPIFKTPITPRENMMAFLNNETPCWMPDNDLNTINPSIIPDNVARGFVQEENPGSECGGPDMFGVPWKFDPVNGGSMVIHGHITLEDVNDWKEVIHFPDVDTWDWAASAQRNRNYVAGDSPVWTTIFTGFFERLISFMDFASAATALIDEDQKDAVKELFDALADTYNKIIDHCVEAYNLAGVNFHDDWGSQRAPFFSKDTWLEMIAPYVKKVVDHCHEKNVIFELHSCGRTESMIDVISSIGIDMWRPQPMNDIKKMYEGYGDRIKLGISSPDFEPDVPIEVQEQAARDMMEEFNLPGKYIYTSNRSETDAFRAALYEASRKAYLEH